MVLTPRISFFVMALALFCIAAATPVLAVEKLTIKKALEADKQAEPTATEKPQEKAEAPEKEEHRAQLDPMGRDTPRSAVKNFMNAGRAGDFEKAAQYLALQGVQLSGDMTMEELAEKFFMVLRRGMWIDYNKLSNDPEGYKEDGLSKDREQLGFLELPDEQFQVLLERRTSKHGPKVWCFASSTARAIPKLYGHYSLGPIGELLSDLLPNFEFMGIAIWEWVTILLLGVAAYFAAWFLLYITRLLFASRWAQLKDDGKRLYNRPLRWLAAILIGRLIVDNIDLSVEARLLFSAKTFLVIIGAWLVLAVTSIAQKRLSERLLRAGRNEATILLKPLATMIKSLALIIAFLVWLDNVGFNVTTLLTSLGVGGIAVAMAAQDTMKNFIGSMAVLLDKPYQVGQRIMIKGHDGIVKEIGLRSTSILGLDGNEVVIPNEIMARSDVVNVSRRPHIRRIFDIRVAYGTPADKLRQAVEAIEKILENHEGINPDFPPRIYFNEFADSTLIIKIWYWYHPPDFWAYNKFSQEVNLRIKQALEALGVEFAFPTRTLNFDSEFNPGQNQTSH